MKKIIFITIMMIECVYVFLYNILLCAPVYAQMELMFEWFRSIVVSQRNRCHSLLME